MGRRGKKPEPPVAATPPVPAPPAPAVAPDPASKPTRRAALALAFSVASGLFFSIHPASLAFWDPGMSKYWRTLYVPGERPRHYSSIADVVPPSARVASTDFVHPRYTHFERSYDYSDYPRKVANYEDRVPHDTDYIVIDTQHHYSKVRSLDQVRELKTEPDKWEVVPNDTQGYFIVLKRKGAPAGDAR